MLRLLVLAALLAAAPSVAAAESLLPVVGPAPPSVETHCLGNYVAFLPSWAVFVALTPYYIALLTLDAANNGGPVVGAQAAVYWTQYFGAGHVGLAAGAVGCAF